MKCVTLIALACFVDPSRGTNSFLRMMGFAPAAPPAPPSVAQPSGPTPTINVVVNARRMMRGCDNVGHMAPETFAERILLSLEVSPEPNLLSCGLNRDGWTTEAIAAAFKRVTEFILTESFRVSPLISQSSGTINMGPGIARLERETQRIGYFLAFAVNSDVKLGIDLDESFLNMLITCKAPVGHPPLFAKIWCDSFADGIHPQRWRSEIHQLKELFE